jgi:protein-arginine kinase activator protein McsA
MNEDFDIIFTQLIDIGEELKVIDIDKNFFAKVNIYKNFHNQIIQILNQPDVDLADYKDRLEQIESNNVFIENRLRTEKDKVKEKIIKENFKEKVKKKYN